MHTLVKPADVSKLKGGTADLDDSAKDLLARLKKAKIPATSVEMEQAGSNVKITVKPDNISAADIKKCLK